MTARLIETDGGPSVVLIENGDGTPLYVVGPILFDTDGYLVGQDNAEILTAIIETGITLELPVINGVTPHIQAVIEARVQEIADGLGVPVGIPG